jgi:hypothetical protein
MLDPNDTSPEFHSVVTPPAAAPTGTPQFATAEYAHIPGTERCRICGNLIPGDYYRINGQMVCPTCAGQALNGQPADSHAAFLRGFLFGIGAAIVALAVYAGFTIATHGFYLGYIALGVGWIIAKAIIKGSNGLGGRHYQIAAVLLTYFAISLAEVPILLAQILRNPNFHGTLSGVFTHFWPRLLWYGVASPFLALQSPFHGAIGLIILFVGLRIAWQLTTARRLPVEGPYSVASA